MIEFQDHFAGRTNILRGPHAARGPYVVHACPRCLWEAVSVSAWLQNRSGGWIDGLFVVVRTSVFAALKVTFHKSDYISNSRRSLDNVVCTALGFLEEHNSIVSSANKEIEDLMFVPMSLTYTKKSKGPSTDPWGTPQFACKCSERKSPKRTNSDLPDR